MESLEALFYGLPAGFERCICLAIKGFPAPKDAAKIAHGLAIMRHGAAIALGKHASHVLFGFGTEPDGEALAEEAIISTGIGNDAAADFISSLADTELILEAPLAEDYLRSAEILRQYADANLDFVDALIAATAERLNIKRLLTLDRRDFQVIRPKHCDGFELLP